MARTAEVAEAEPQTLDIDPRIDLCKPIWAQSQQLWLQDEAEESATSILEALKPHLTQDDDPALWASVLKNVLLDIHTRDEEDHVPIKRFLKIGCCSHWFRPHQARWTAAGGFAWPTGWHGVSGYSSRGLPELDWSALFEAADRTWRPVEKFSGKDRLEVRVSIPARSARHLQAAIHTLWTPMNEKVFYGFRKKNALWKLAARSDFYMDTP
jgi:hypothetical protein